MQCLLQTIKILCLNILHCYKDLPNPNKQENKNKPNNDNSNSNNNKTQEV